MTKYIELKAVRDGQRTLLTVPEVGLFTRALHKGALVSGGQDAGHLLQLGKAIGLRVPAGASGRIANPRPDAVLAPVGYGDVLYELEPIAEGDEAQAQEAAEEAAAGGLVLYSPHTGRFWHRPSPDEPAFCKVGDLLGPGAAVGIVEIMKTFTQVGYSTDGNLPSSARVVKLLAADGEDVTEGAPLIEVEPA
ncbi:MAG: acetyl-CoA carboxylase biotin carboxyl carrier protein [Bacteroidia bacterium]|jgi:acetyl-CoA carboxylase biotin carboxyl carrier protein